VLGVIPGLSGRRYEQVRYLVFIEISANGQIGRGSKSVEQEQDLILFNQLANDFDCLRRAVAVIAADEVDLPTVDTSLVVDHREVGRLRFTYDSVGGSRPAIGHRVADLDLGVITPGPYCPAAKGCLLARTRLIVKRP